MISRRRRTALRLLATAGLAATIVLAAGTPAMADDGVTLTPSTQTVEFGQSWGINGQITTYSGCDSCYGSLVVTIGGVAHTVGPGALYQGAFGFADATFLPDTVLGVGTHSISASFVDGSTTTASSPAPVKVIITPAPLASTTTIAEDPNNSRNAIISAHLSGDFIDQLPGCSCEDGGGDYPMPAGTWNLTVTNSKGAVVLSKQQQQAAAGNPFFVSYWPSVPAGETFTAETTFTVAAASSANFTLSSQKFSWTSAKASPSKAGGSTSGPTRTKPTASAGFAPPVWLLGLVLIIAVLIAALDVVLFVIRRRRSKVGRPAGEVSP